MFPQWSGHWTFDRGGSLAQLPQRIVCLTEETTETLYLLGEDQRIVGISGYTVRPPQARQKPRVSAFINAKFDKILALRPDLVLTFSDLQADIARELIRRGVNVLAFNQRSVSEILNMILTVASIVGVLDKGRQLVSRFEADLNAIRASADRFASRPRVFFEEWNNPLISGICWVEELVEIAGGTPIFPELRSQKNAPDRIVDPLQVVPRDPETIIASWCGAKVNKNTIRSRPGWNDVAAVRNNHVYEIKSTYILQPGPAALTEGVRQLHTILAHVAHVDVAEDLACSERVDPELKRPRT
jgi:iron complex transport system substrate-binding protein